MISFDSHQRTISGIPDGIPTCLCSIARKPSDLMDLCIAGGESAAYKDAASYDLVVLYRTVSASWVPEPATSSPLDTAGDMCASTPAYGSEPTTPAATPSPASKGSAATNLSPGANPGHKQMDSNSGAPASPHPSPAAPAVELPEHNRRADQPSPPSPAVELADDTHRADQPSPPAPEAPAPPFAPAAPELDHQPPPLPPPEAPPPEDPAAPLPQSDDAQIIADARKSLPSAVSVDKRGKGSYRVRFNWAIYI